MFKFFAFGLLLCALWPQPSTTQNVYPLDKAIKELSAIARVTNGIALQTELPKNPNKLNDIVAELLGVQSGDQLVKIKALVVEDLANQLGQLHAVIEAVPDLQVDMSALKTSFTDLEAMKTSIPLLETGVTDPSATLKIDWDEAANRYKWRSNASTEASYFRLAAERLLIPLHQDIEEQHNIYRGIFIPMQDATDIASSQLDMLLDYKSTDEKMLKLVDIHSKMKDVADLAEISEKFVTNFQTISTMGTSLGHLKDGIQHLKTVTAQQTSLAIARNSLEQISTAQLQLEPSNPTLHFTNGFADGFSDLKKLNQDFKSKTLKKLISEDKDLKDLQKSLSSLIGFANKISAVSVKRDNYVASKNETTLADVISLLSDALKTPNLAGIETTLATLQTCFKDLKLPAAVPNYKVTRAFLSLIAELSSEIKRYFSFVESQMNLLTEMNSTLKSVDSSLKKINVNSTLREQTNVWNSVKNTPNLEILIENLNNTYAGFEEFRFKNPFLTVQKVVNWDVVPIVIQSLEGTKLVDSLNCLKTYNMTEISTFFNFTADVMNMKTKKQEIATTQTLVTSLASLKLSLKHLEQTLESKGSRRRRATSPKSITNLKNAQKIATDLGRGVQVLREYQKIKNTKRSIQVATKAQGPLKSAVDAIQGTQGVWTEDNRKSLDKLLLDLSGMEGSVGRVKRNNMALLFQVFDEAGKIHGVQLDAKIFSDPIGKELEKSSDPIIKSAAQDFNNIGALDLNFLQNHVHLLAASQTLIPLQHFFDDYFGIQQLSTTSETSVETNTNWAIIGLAIMIMTMILGLAVFAGFMWMKKRRIAAKQVSSIPSKPSPSNEKTTETTGTTGTSVTSGIDPGM